MIKEETKTPVPAITFQTRAGSIIGVSNISELMKFSKASFFAERHAGASVSSIRRRQLTGSDTLLWQVFPECRIERMNGQPYLSNDDRHISISHTGDLLALIIGRERVAIDIEPVSRSVRKIETKFCNDVDLSAAKLVFPANPSLLVWCAKECLFKHARTHGVDFRTHLQIVEVEDEQTLLCRIDHTSVKAYLRVNFFVFDQLLIAHIG